MEYLIKMTEEEAMIDLRAGVEHRSPGQLCWPVLHCAVQIKKLLDLRLGYFNVTLF